MELDEVSVFSETLKPSRIFSSGKIHIQSTDSFSFRSLKRPLQMVEFSKGYSKVGASAPSVMPATDDVESTT